MNSINIKILSEEIQRLKADSGGDQAQLDDLFNIGAKNQLPVPYYTSSGTEVNGITYTVNSDGSISLSHTTSTDISRFYLYGGAGNANLAPNIFANMRIYAKYTNLDITQAYIYAQPFNADYSKHLNLNDVDGNGFIIPGGIYTKLRIAVYVKPGYEVPSDAKIEVMAVPASVKDLSYQEYSRTNHQLTAEMDKLLCKETDADTYVLTATVDAQGAITYAWVSTT